MHVATQKYLKKEREKNGVKDGQVPEQLKQ